MANGLSQRAPPGQPDLRLEERLAGRGFFLLGVIIFLLSKWVGHLVFGRKERISK